jgi:hypothetical protein
MGFAVHNIAGSIAGTQQQARVTNRDAERKEPAKARRARDEFDQAAEASEVEHADAVRSLKDNSQEETHEDRREHAGQNAVYEHHEPATYTPERGPLKPPRLPAPRLDLEG